MGSHGSRHLGFLHIDIDMLGDDSSQRYTFVDHKFVKAINSSTIGSYRRNTRTISCKGPSSLWALMGASIGISTH